MSTIDRHSRSRSWLHWKTSQQMAARRSLAFCPPPVRVWPKVTANDLSYVCVKTASKWSQGRSPLKKKKEKKGGETPEPCFLYVIIILIPKCKLLGVTTPFAQNVFLPLQLSGNEPGTRVHNNCFLWKYRSNSANDYDTCTYYEYLTSAVDMVSDESAFQP